MYTEFAAYLKSRTGLSDEMVDAIAETATVRTLKRNEFLLESGAVCRHKAFIAKGMLRTFGTGSTGNEFILQFSPENSWTLDVESYDKKIPAALNIAAVEPSVVLLWAKEDFEKLLALYPGLKKFSEQLISHNVHQSRQRMATVLSATPEEKYEGFLRDFPGLSGRLPLKMIAAYLGISIKTLTRVRSAQLQRH